MFAQCIERCPDDLWISGTHPRTYWRIAFHAAFFTHVYLFQDEKSFEPWPARKQGVHEDMWADPSAVEPYELPESAEILSRTEMLEYLAYIDGLVNPLVDALNLDSPESGFRWYGAFDKLSHQLLNLRHIQGHVGQLSELLMMRGIDIDWISRG